MYIALFDSNFNLTGDLIKGVTCDFIKKTFDFDTISLKGNCPKRDWIDTVFFTLNEDDGKQYGSGFVKKLIPKDDTVEIIGVDFRTLLDTEMMIDLTNAPGTIGGLIDFIFNRIKTDPDLTTNLISIKEPNTTGLGFYYKGLFGNPQGNEIVNIYKYLMGFFKYYMLVLKAEINWITKEIEFSIVQQGETKELRLEDFEHDLSRNEPDFSKAIASPSFGIKYEYLLHEGRYYIEYLWRLFTSTYTTEYEWKFQEDLNKDVAPYTSETGSCSIGYTYKSGTCYPNANWQDVLPLQIQWATTEPPTTSGYRWVKTGNQRNVNIVWYATETYVWNEFKPAEDNDDEEWLLISSRDTVEWVPTSEPTVYSEAQPIADEGFLWIETGNLINPPDIVYYYLDKDNNIIESNEIGNLPNRYYPVKAKYFVNEKIYFAKYNAILGLSNQRYVDSLYIDDTIINPVDLKLFNLLDMVKVYDSNGFKNMPVSEKILKIDSKGRKERVKLGFKKNKLTEIIKG